MPSLRKNAIWSWFCRGTIVRMVLIPADLNSVEIASNNYSPMPCKRVPGSTAKANTQPQGSEPNSHPRTSPTM